MRLTWTVVVSMPAGNPVFKKHIEVSDAHHRVAMRRAAIEDNPAFDVSTLEVDRAGDTYTVDTLETLRAHYPENVELYFIAGADAILTLPQWRACAASCSPGELRRAQSSA